MRFTFLGTSAANAFPEPFCECLNCRQARLAGGKSLRKRSAGLVNEDLLIDLGPDVLTAANQNELVFSQLRYCLQTHAHADHLDPTHLFSRSREYGVVGAAQLHFYASSGTLNHAAELLKRDCAPNSFFSAASAERLNLQLHKVRAFEPFSCGAYQVVPFPANHDPEVEPLLFAVEHDGKSLFYGTDTAELPETVWEGFKRFNLQFDLVILDHTYGPTQPASDHLNAQRVADYAARMRLEKILKENGRVFATHIAHEGNPPHEQLEEIASGQGYEIAYDGLVVRI